jgi:hypothetical protein
MMFRISAGRSVKRGFCAGIPAALAVEGLGAVVWIVDVDMC